MDSRFLLIKEEFPGEVTTVINLVIVSANARWTWLKPEDFILEIELFGLLTYLVSLILRKTCFMASVYVQNYQNGMKQSTFSAFQAIIRIAYPRKQHRFQSHCISSYSSHELATSNIRIQNWRVLIYPEMKVRLNRQADVVSD